MPSFRLWTHFGLLLLVVSASSSASPSFSEQPAAPAPVASREVPPPPTESDRSIDNHVKLQPEPDSQLPRINATPAFGPPANLQKTGLPLDIDAQFEVPIEIPSRRGKETETDAPKAAEEQAPADPLMQLIDKAIDVSSRRYLTAGVHTPWQIFHGLLGYRRDFQLKTQDGGKISALEWASQGASFHNESLFMKTPYGGMAHPYNVIYWFEGHPTQFMAYLTMCRLPTTHVFKTAQGEPITVADIINNAKMESVEDPMVEMTWTLWALSHYLEPDAQWVNKKGEPWSVERLVKIETANKVYDGPCGGTHNLFALSYARNSQLQMQARRHMGSQLRGIWLEADQKIQRFIAEGRALQNPDGSFSIHYFKGPGFSQEFTPRITSSGHILEWLMVALPQSRLSEDWVQSGLRRLALDLIENRHLNAECGPLYHSVDALQIYRERMQLVGRIAQEPKRTTALNTPRWKAAPTTSNWPRSRTVLMEVHAQESNRLQVDVQRNGATAPTKSQSIRSPFGPEVVIPKRTNSVQSAEKPGNKAIR